MASLKTSVRLTEDTQKIIQAISLHGQPNWSFGVNQIAHRYDVLTKHALPKLNKGEKYALYEAFNGHIFNDDIELEAKALMWTISECIQYNTSFIENLVSEETDPDEFYLRVKSWSLVECIAVIQVVQSLFNNNKPLVDGS